MLRAHGFLLIFYLIAISLLPVNCADNYTDENRPYEFGFNIEGEQHRHEKKDENGLIMGEFGFITADGVYHVTVYATDENGNFKILSMKNIRVRPYPTAKTGDRTGHSLKLPAAPEPAPTPEATTLAPTTTTVAPTVRTPKRISLQPPRACSHCSIPTTSTLPPPASVEEHNNANAIAQAPQSNKPAPISPNILPPVANNYQQSPAPNDAQSPAVNPQFGSRSNIPGENSPNNLAYNQQPGINTDNYPQQPNPASNPSSNPNPQGYNPEVQESIPNPPQQGQRESKQYNLDDNNIDNGIQTNYNENKAPEKPVLISAQMQIVDKNTDIYHKNPGETDGLPQGLNADDMTTLLYTFNYTVGFHGHYEEGYRNGAKKGYYFITGRNGVRTRVDYEADEKGFRPRISQDVLDLLSDEVPKPETEKDEKYGLKGYEFKWLYYPVSSRK